MVAAYIRTVFAQPTPDAVRDQLDTVADTLAVKLPAVAAMLRESKADLTAFADFPHAHWAKIWSTNPSNESTRNSSDAPTSSGSSPTPTPCCGCQPARSSRHTTSGSSPTAATYPKGLWPCSTQPHRSPSPPAPRR